MSAPDAHLRLFVDADLEACVALCAANSPEHMLPHEVEELREFLVEKPYAPAPYFVVEAEGVIVACGGVATEGAELHLCWGLVHPDWQRRGLGTRLVEHRLDWARGRAGLEVARLCTSQRTRAFYERFGFKSTRFTPDGFGPGLDRHDMERPL